jgi:hypothetical protein
MRRFSFGVRLMVVAAAVSAVAIAVTAGGAGAAGNATLNLQVFPSTILTGGAGAILATFQNNGPSTDNHAVVTVDLNGATFDQANSSAGCTPTSATPSGTGASCLLVGGGSISAGSTVFTTIAFTNGPSTAQQAPCLPNPPFSAPCTTFGSTVTWNSKTTGKPGSSPGNQTFTLGGSGGTADLLSAGSLLDSGSTCGGGSAHANNNGNGINVSAGSNTAHLTCTPITVGIDQSGILFTKMPTLTAPANVTLTFPDEQLPWPSYENPPAASNLCEKNGKRDPCAPTQLIEYPNYPDTSTQVQVPACSTGPHGPTLPVNPPAGFSTDACIVSITSTDADGDFDAGTITLLAQGSNTGDSGFHGH